MLHQSRPIGLETLVLKVSRRVNWMQWNLSHNSPIKNKILFRAKWTNPCHTVLSYCWIRFQYFSVKK